MNYAHESNEYLFRMQRAMRMLGFCILLQAKKEKEVVKVVLINIWETRR